jgi:hypothetical protein
MFSEKDFERLWFLYKTEGEPKGVSINSFCISNNIPYTAFYDWFKKAQKKVVPVEVEGIPEELIRKHSVNHVFSSPTSIINFTSKKPSYDDTRRSGRDNELLQRAQNDL